jgi:hypothetical protein
VSAPLPAVDPPAPPARNRGLLVVAAASVLTLLGVTAVALTRRAGPATQPTPVAAPIAADVSTATPTPSTPLVPAVTTAAAVDLVVDVPMIPQVADVGVAPTAAALVAATDPRARNAPRLARDAAVADPAANVRAELAYQETVRTLMRARHVEFVACYERGTEGNANLSGSVDISLQVSTDGRPSGVTTRGLPTAPEVGRCIAVA